MQLEIIKTPKTYKLISKSSKKHPLLIHIANLLKEANKYSEVKVGVYNITGGLLQDHITVYSYLSNKTERMSRVKYYKFLKGKHQVTVKKQEWKPTSESDLLDDLLK